MKYLYRYHNLVRLLLVAGFLSCNANASSLAQQGVWQGTIGRQQVMACFGEQSGEYYYLQHADSTLSLDTKQNDQWAEMYNSQETGFWNIESITDANIKATWANANKKQALPILLSRLPVTVDDNPCANDAFIHPRILRMSIDKGKIEHYNGHAYRKIQGTHNGVSGIEIIGSANNIAQLNTAMRVDMLDEIEHFNECIDIAKSVEYPQGYYSAEFKPLFWNQNWLSLQLVIDTDCVGHYPERIISTKTYDVRNGKVVDPWQWFIASDDSMSALFALILQSAKGNPSDERCLDVLHENPVNTIWLNKQGLFFYTQLPHVAAACSEELFVPFEKLMPFLNPEGKKLVESIQN